MSTARALASAPLPLWALAGPALGLALYGNGVSLVLANVTPAGGWLGVALGLVPALSMLVWARLGLGLTLADIGLRRQGAWRSALLGLGVAVVLAAPSLFILVAPPVIGEPVSVAPLSTLSPGELLTRALVWMPLDTALPEELAFRGVLLAALLLRFSAPRAVVLSAVVFTVWHVVIVSRTVGVTNLAEGELLLALGLAGSYLSVGVGGVIFAVLRLATGHLAGSIVAHWAFNAFLLLGLYVA